MDIFSTTSALKGIGIPHARVRAFRDFGNKRKAKAMIAASKAKVSPGKLLIDGKWSEGSGKSFDTFNPATGEVLTQVAEGGSSGVDQAVAAARKAFDDVNGARYCGASPT